MRNRFDHNTFTKNFQFRNRFFHGLQPTQDQNLQSTLSEDNDVNVQDTYEDNMDFQYDNELNDSQSEKLSENENDNNDNDESEDEETDEETDEEIGEETDEETDEETGEETNETTDEETDKIVDDDDNDDEIESLSSEDEENHNHIIDEALNKNKMPFYNSENEFAPYFENFTTAALFCWLQKHKISTSAYEDLAKIIHDPQFVTTHVVKNVRRIRTWRKHLPLLPISEKNISISSRKTPSTSKDSKMAYQLSINDIIWHVLNNPSLMIHMYFDPGIDSEIKSEYWHGTLWGESPFYGQEKLTISRG
jgi:hypothetical protein